MAAASRTYAALWMKKTEANLGALRLSTIDAADASRQDFRPANIRAVSSMVLDSPRIAAGMGLPPSIVACILHKDPFDAVRLHATYLSTEYRPGVCR